MQLARNKWRWRLLEPHLAPLATGLVVLLALALRLYRLEDKSFWWDEGWTLWLAKQDFLAAALRTASDEHPPLFYWFIGLWSALTGDGEFALRYSSILFALLTVALVYSLGHTIAGPWVGVGTAFLLAISRFHIWWSQELRGYTAAILLALLSLHLFLRWLKKPSRAMSLAYVAATLGALLTLYLTAFVLLIEGLLFLFSLRASRGCFPQLVRYGLLQLTVIVLYSPWVYVYLTRSVSMTRSEPLDFGLFLRLYATVLPLGVSTDIEDYFWPMAFFLALAVAGIVGGLRDRDRRREGTFLAVLCFIVVPLGVYLFSLPGRSFYHPKIMARYVIIFLPLYLILIAQGISFFWKRTSLLGGVAAGVTLVLFAQALPDYFASRQQTSEYAAAGNFIRTHIQPGDALVLNSDFEWPVYSYYVGFTYPWYSIPSGEVLTPQLADHWLKPVPSRHSSVWLITTPEAIRTDPKREVPRWLSSQYRELRTSRYGRIVVSLYSQELGRDAWQVPAQRPLPKEARATTIQNIQYLDVSSFPKRPKSGGTLYASTFWRSLDDNSGWFLARLGLYDVNGRALKMGQPQPIAPSRRPWRAGETLSLEQRLALSPGLAPGQYELRVEVEQPFTGERWSLPADRFYLTGGAAQLRRDPENEVEATLGDAIQLTGYDLSSHSVKPGERLRLTLYWQALKDNDTDYTVFVHLIGAGETILAQQDRYPADGLSPTSTWQAGDSITDSYFLRVPSNFSGDEVTLAVGLYDAPTLERLPVTESDSTSPRDRRVTLERVPVRP